MGRMCWVWVVQFWVLTVVRHAILVEFSHFFSSQIGHFQIPVECQAVQFIVEPIRQLALVLELGKYPPTHAILTPAISPITGRLVEGGSVLFFPVQAQTTCPLPTSAGCALCIKHIPGSSKSNNRGILLEQTTLPPYCTVWQYRRDIKDTKHDFSKYILLGAD